MASARMRIPGKSLALKTLILVFVVIPLCVVSIASLFLAGGALGAYLVYSHDLPEVPNLRGYQPRTVSTFYAEDGTVIGIFYKQKRFVVDVRDIPQHVIDAFMAAEDERFYQHNGIDWKRIVPVVAYIKLKAGRMQEGGSTITQQVIRNFSLTAEKKLARKIREIILALRVEEIWSKQRILYVYLNEIYLGDGCYGVEAAARNYFNKPVQQLTVAEGALIAGIVPSPARYNPFKNKKMALLKQRLVLKKMLDGGFINKREYDKVLNEKLEFKKEVTKPFDLVPDFSEAVRLYVIKKYGEAKLYHEGLKVFTTCRIDYQKQAIKAMEKGLKQIRARHKHLGLMRSLKISEIPDYIAGRRPPELIEGNNYQGVVTTVVKKGNQETHLHVSLSPGFEGLVKLKKDFKVYQVGSVMSLRFEGFQKGTALFEPDERGRLQGALVCIENTTGYVRALVGGSSREHYQFNRALQAKRAPGSAFQPIVYAAGLEGFGYSPGTIVVDENIEIDLEVNNRHWSPRNADGKFLGPISFRRALELSRNICTTKIFMDASFDPVMSMAKKMGITSKLGRNLQLSLGASEMTLFELTSAYSVFPNKGVFVQPILVKRIEDRHGNVLEDNTRLVGLEDAEMPRPTRRREFADTHRGEESAELWEIEAENAETSSESPMGGGALQSNAKHSKLRDTTSREYPALSRQTAFVMTSMLQGVVRTGTGAKLSEYLNRKDLAGKTGTTNNAEDAWFIGFNPDFTTGVWVGFDEKRSMGRREAGSTAALPIWAYFMKSILDKVPENQFPVPPDICFQEMLTFDGSTEEGFEPTTVSEPVYCPFVGNTLILSPLDDPEILTAFTRHTKPEGPLKNRPGGSSR